MNDANPLDRGSVPSRETSLRDVLSPLFRRKKLVTLTFSVVLVAAIGACILASMQYRARMEVLVNRERVDPTVGSATQPLSLGFPISEQEINSEVELLKSPDVLAQVVLANGLQDREGKGLLSMFGRKDEEWRTHLAVDRLSNKLRIQGVLKTDMIEITYPSSDPQLAYGVLNTLAKFYLDKHLAVRRPTGSFEFFSKQTDRYKQALDDAQNRLKEFGKEGGVAPDIEREGLANQIVASIAATKNLQQSIAANKRRLLSAQSQMGTTPARSSSLEVSNSPSELLQQLEGNLVAAQVKRNQLLAKFQPDYPVVLEADKEVTQIKSAIAEASKTRYVSQTTDRDSTYELLRQDFAKTQSDLSSQQAQEAALEASIRDMRKQMVELDDQSLKQADLLREVKTDESNYLLYLSKREQERTSDALDQKRIGNVSLAVPPVVPMSPDKSPALIFALGLILALFISLGTAFVAEYLDPSFRTPDEVVEVLRIPVLASIARQKA
jgi:uncharacterized protein involved in exopolysaccharide biosynthesis